MHQAGPSCAEGQHRRALSAAGSGSSVLQLTPACFAQPTGTHAVLCTFALQGLIKSLEQIYLFSMPVKEYQIVEYFLGSALKDEVMKIMPVQKQTRAGQRTRFKVQKWCAPVSAQVYSLFRSRSAPLPCLCPDLLVVELCAQAFVVVGDYNGHVGLGVKCAKEVSAARGAHAMQLAATGQTWPAARVAVQEGVLVAGVSAREQQRALRQAEQFAAREASARPTAGRVCTCHEL